MSWILNREESQLKFQQKGNLNNQNIFELSNKDDPKDWLTDIPTRKKHNITWPAHSYNDLSITKKEKNMYVHLPEHVCVSRNKSGKVNKEVNWNSYFPEFPNIALVEMLPWTNFRCQSAEDVIHLHITALSSAYYSSLGFTLVIASFDAVLKALFFRRQQIPFKLVYLTLLMPLVHFVILHLRNKYSVTDYYT